MDRSADCVLCDVVGRTASWHEYVAETDRAVAFMDANPAVSGHTLVVPRQHAVDI